MTNRRHRVTAISATALLLLLTACSSTESLGVAATATAAPVQTLPPGIAEVVETSEPETVPEPQQELDLSTPEGVCRGIPGLEKLAEQWLPEISNVDVGLGGGNIESFLCQYIGPEGDMATVSFRYSKNNGACSEIFGQPALGDTYHPWEALEQGNFVAHLTSLNSCSETNGVATYYQVGTAIIGEDLPDIGEAELRAELSGLTTDTSRFSEVAVAARALVQG